MVFELLIISFPCCSETALYLGNLALSRALGDFIFKRNTDKRPEEQVVTGTDRKSSMRDREVHGSSHSSRSGRYCEDNNS